MGTGGPNGGTAAGIPCVARFRSTAGNYTHEWILVGRIDQNFSDKDRVNFRYRMDRGVQATYTDPISPVFNAFSTQPQYEGQSVWNHVFSPNMTNQFIASGSWYSAVFNASNPNSALGAYPYTAFFNFCNTHQCLTTSMFNDSVLTFSGQRRNQFRGPGFFDSDFTVVKNFNLGEKAKFGLGFNFYNVFNHPNFANPNANLTGGNFGQITATVSPATSALGSFLGADQSPRFIQLKATISF